MISHARTVFKGNMKWFLIITAWILVVFLQSEAQAFIINVKTDGPNGTRVPIDVGFRYLIEEDNSFYVIPGTPAPQAVWPDPTNTLAVNTGHSHAPVVCAGDTGALCIGSACATTDTASNPSCIIDPNKKYIVSVIPWHENPKFYPASQTTGPWFSNQPGFTMSGHTVAGNAASVDINVARFPVPTAQITIIVFHDNDPINGAVDQPAETGLGGFNLLVSDPVGKMMQDSWGNPVGTTYRVQRSGICTTVLPYFPGGTFCPPLKDANGNYQFILDASTGVPIIDYTGNGTLTTCPSGNSDYDKANCTDLDTGVPLAAGEAVIRFLSPNRYAVEPIPPANDPDWLLTATIEGTRANDAWVRAAEPRFQLNTGQLNWVAFFGFVKACDAFNGKPCTPLVTPPAPAGPRGTITGRIVNAHDLHPPLVAGIPAGNPTPDCFVGLNNLSGFDEQVYTAPCNADSTFTINNMPPGIYQLVAWDKEMNIIINFSTVTVSAAGGTVDLGDVAVGSWFGTLQGSVFSDTSGSATLTSAQLPDNTLAPGIAGIANSRVSVHSADGSSLYATTTDANGNYQFNQVFPFMRWLIVQSDPGVIGKNYGRFKSTGMTTIIDDGGFLTVPPGGCPVPYGCPPNVNPNPYASFGINPQIQTGTGLPYRVEPSVAGNQVQSEAMTLNPSMTTVINWGKQPYGPTENGGIKGFISYATSRTQEDPERSFWQGWEPGIPRVQVNLYYAVQACTLNPGAFTGADSGTVCTNNPALCTVPGETCNWVPASCSVTPINGITTLTACTPSVTLTPVNTTYTSSFDDANPTQCVGDSPVPSTPGGANLWSNPEYANGIPIRNCATTARTWDQVRPGVFDGQYAFHSYCSGAVAASYPPLTPVGLATVNGIPDVATFTGGPNITCDGSASGFTEGLPVGNYIVQAVPPKGYEALKWGDRNIEFGEPNVPFQAYPPQCVGQYYAVPMFHQLFADWQIPTPYPAPGQWYCIGGAIDANGFCTVGGVPTLNPAIGPVAPSCAMRVIDVAQGQHSIVDFRMFTQVPKSARVYGTITDDIHAESNPKSPNAGDKLGPSFIPVSIIDWAGKTVWRGYTDQWGHFEGVVPSTYTIFTPNPLGMSAGIYTVRANNPGPIVDQSWTTGMPIVCDGTQPAGSVCVTDPFFNPAYGQETIRLHWDFYAGTSTLVDSVVLPSAAIISRIPPNCDTVNHTPEIRQVDSSGLGPIVRSGVSSILTITSAGWVEAPNPDLNENLPLAPTATCLPGNHALPPPGTNCAVIWQDHGFGAQGPNSKVTVGGVSLPINSWTNDAISATATPALTTGELLVTRDNPVYASYPLTSVAGVTLQVVPDLTKVVVVSPPSSTCNPYTDVSQCRRIQPAIDLPTTTSGTLISIKPGAYMESVIMYKAVKLQGWGAESTVLDGTAAMVNLPGKDAWSTLFRNLIGATCSASTPCISSPPGAVLALPATDVPQAAGIMVSGCDPSANTCANAFTQAAGSMIDGLTITGYVGEGGGLWVNSFAPYLTISNNLIYGNQGFLSGGIRTGTPSLVNGAAYSSSHNEHMTVINNLIVENGSFTSGGGGISLYKGSDGYLLKNNLLCGNFASLYGGGICHFGLSPDGFIDKNVIVSNESFDEGGGIMVAGELPITPALLGEGAGNVAIRGNLIQGNKAGDDGGGIRTLMFNGTDVSNNPANPSLWGKLKVFNNMIVSNSSADHGGGMSFDDTVYAYVINNTIAWNDSTATGSGAFGGGCTTNDPLGQFCPVPPAGGGLITSIPRVGGIASYFYGSGLTSAVATSPIPNRLKAYSSPYLYNDIIWHNRSFYWDATLNNAFGGLAPIPINGGYWDLAVYGRTANFTPSSAVFICQWCLLSDGIGTVASGTNLIGTPPSFVKPYVNTYEASSNGSLAGNFVSVFFTPIGLMNSSDALYGNYHLNAGSPAIGAGTSFTTTLGNLFTAFPNLTKDYDNQARPAGGVDIGADEYYPMYGWFPW